MHEKIAAAKTFVKKHKTTIACASGVVVGATATYFILRERNDNRLVELNSNDMEWLNSGKVIATETPSGSLYIVKENHLPRN